MSENVLKFTRFFIVLVFFAGCKTYHPKATYSDQRTGLAPDYSNLDYWAAHPIKNDPADQSPDQLAKPGNEMPADVFFIHPTIYYGDKGEDEWNGPVDSKKLNEKVDNSTILFQASAFNQAGNVYAPRYRQAHLDAYFSKDSLSSCKAFELAYQDVKSAFVYYLEHDNKGKPFIIASHSQGTNHAKRLIAEFLDGKPLGGQLIAAYLIGMPVKKDRFTSIGPCRDGDDTGCFVSWRTFKKGYDLKGSQSDVSVTNPLSWKTTTEYVGKKENHGSILKKFNDIYDQLVDAQVADGILWANKPKFPGSFFFRRKNYHIADINFYYFSIRENAKNRVLAYLKEK